VNALRQRETAAERLRQLGCDPIAGMAKLAQDETVPTVLLAPMFAELAHYVAPRAKTADHAADHAAISTVAASYGMKRHHS
jgi:DNA-binding ferritin-like protein